MSAPTVSRAWGTPLAAVLVAAGVLQAAGIGWATRLEVAPILWGLAVVVLALRGPAPERQRHTIVLGLLFGAAAVLAAGVWRGALGAAALGSLLEAVPLPASAARLARRLGRAVQACVVAGLVAAAVTIVAARVSLGVQTLPWAAAPIAAALRWLGFEATTFSGGVGISTLHSSPTVPTTWSTLGIFSLLAFWVSVCALRLHAGTPIGSRGLLRLTGIVLLAGAFRLLLAFASLFHYEIFLNFDAEEWPVGFLLDPTFQMLGIALVAVPLLAVLDRERVPVVPGSGMGLSWRRALVVGFAALLTALFLVWEEGGERRSGRVLIDEGHSRWEAVEPTYDTEWYGFDSGYNFAAIASLLDHHYDLVIHRDDLTRDVLRDVDVLIVKVPTRPHSPTEIEAVVDFVRSGGGLFLVGEHTNVWGSSFYLNALARPLGFRFRSDVVFDFRKKFEQIYSAPSLGRHPSSMGVRDFLFAVSCSIEPHSPVVKPVMHAGGLWSLDIDYAVDNFYPTPNLTPEVLAGMHAEMVARRFGKGRVAGFGDSTVWSTFSALLPGKPELLLGTVEWLNRRGRFPDPYPLALLLLLALAVGCAAAAWRNPLAASWLLAVVVVGGLAGVRVADALNRHAYPPPQARDGYNEVCFVDAPEVYELPAWGFVRDYDRSYSIFYQWVLRLGYFPKVIADGDRLPPAARVIVCVAGDRPLGQGERAVIDSALDQGLPVLLLVRQGADASVAAYLQEHGLEIRATEPRVFSPLRVTGQGETWPQAWQVHHALHGGTALLEGAEDDAVLVRSAAVPLYVLLGAEMFSDSWMGDSQGNVPDAELRRHFELEFSLFRGLVEGDLEAELRHGATRTLQVRSTGLAGQDAPAVDRPSPRQDSN